MTYEWFPKAAYIQSLYRPWSPAAGCPAAEISAVEQTLGLAFPDRLRRFYLAWGKHAQLTQADARLLNPAQVFVQLGALHFCIENQGVGHWAIQLDTLGEADPLVYFGYVDHLDEEGVDHWTPYYPLSSFLDALALGHAFAGGSACGGISAAPLDASQRALLQQHWPPIQFNIAASKLKPRADSIWRIHGSPGLALEQGVTGELWAAAGDILSLDRLQQLLKLNWKTRW